MSSINDERREYMAGVVVDDEAQDALAPEFARILERVQLSPHRRQILVASAADVEDSWIRRRLIDGCFEKGRAAAAGGASRESCPYKSTNGGFRAAWLTGFDEAVGEAVERGSESGIGVGPGASTPGPVGRGVKRESDAPQTEGIVDRNDTTQ